MIFVSAKGINNKADGTYKDMKILDKYDLNQNGKTNDYVGCFSSANNSLSIQIIGKNVTLDIYDNISVNNVAGDDGGAIYWEGNTGVIYNVTCRNNKGISIDKLDGT